MTKQELATKIWATANELRKNIKASEYKDYILGFMFYKYLCDKETDYLRDLGGEAEDLKEADDDIKDKFKDGIGYFISYGNLFSVWKESGTNFGAKDVSEALDAFYLDLNGRYKTVFDKGFSALQTGLTKLGENAGSRDKAVRDIVDLVDLIPPTSRDYDVLGYIYEYLIQQFSSEAKKDGAFYTPHELTSLMSRILADRLKDRKEVSVYDGRFCRASSEYRPRNWPVYSFRQHPVLRAGTDIRNGEPCEDESFHAGRPRPEHQHAQCQYA